MPQDHQKYLEWNGERFRQWAERIGCMGLLKLAEKYSASRLESACKKALSFTATPSYKSIKNILVTGNDQTGSGDESAAIQPKTHGITRGAGYYRR